LIKINSVFFNNRPSLFKPTLVVAMVMEGDNNTRPKRKAALANTAILTLDDFDDTSVFDDENYNEDEIVVTWPQGNFLIVPL
jgi:hypothetical protein